MTLRAKPSGRKGKIVAGVTRVRHIGARLRLRLPGPSHLPNDLIPRDRLLTWN